MSRTGKKPIDVPSGVNVDIKDRVVAVKGPLGELSYILPAGVVVSMDDKRVLVSLEAEADKKAGAMQGLARTLIANMIEGVLKGFIKELEIQGVGFKAEVKDGNIAVYAGFANSVDLPIPEGVQVKVAENTKIAVTGYDKQVIGDFAARIRKIFPAEPYKGKGIRYKDEYVRRKAGKTVA